MSKMFIWFRNYILNYNSFKKWSKEYCHYEYKNKIQYKLIGFCFSSGLMVFRANNYGIFYYIKLNKSFFL